MAGRTRGLRRPLDQFAGMGVVLAGCFLSFYLVGFLIIPAGVWYWRRALAD